MRIYCAWLPHNGGKQCDSRVDKLSDFPSASILNMDLQILKMFQNFNNYYQKTLRDRAS